MPTFLRHALLFLIACIYAWPVLAQSGGGQLAGLHARYKELQPQLAQNAYGRPVYLDSKETADSVEGDIYSELAYPFRTLKNTLSQPGNWCDILILHINIKYCRVAQNESGNVLTIYAGKKQFQELSSAYRIDYRFSEGASTNQYQQVLMTADAGPFGTTDYRILLEAVPLAGNKSFIHIRYSYRYGVMAKVAMQSYLNTLGSGKAGFTVEGEDAEGNPAYVGGLRGAIERNTMRYYLAIDAYLKSLRLPEGQRFEARLRDWHRSTERYAHQLRELSLNEYMAMKRKENERMKAEE